MFFSSQARRSRPLSDTGSQTQIVLPLTLQLYRDQKGLAFRTASRSER